MQRSVLLLWGAEGAMRGLKGVWEPLQVAPGIYPLLVERIIVARPDLLKADVKEVAPHHISQNAGGNA